MVKILELCTTILVSDLPYLCSALLVLDRASTTHSRLVARVELENNDKVASVM